jgi:serine/threonine-protein kinase mTOR
VVYSTLKVMWATGRKQETFDFLRKFCLTLASDVGALDGDLSKFPQIKENRHLLARSYLKQGQWQQELIPAWTPDIIEEILNCYQMATEFDPVWSKAWHSWALCNFEAINHLEALDDDSVDPHDDLLVQYTLAAIKGIYPQAFFSTGCRFLHRVLPFGGFKKR